MNEIGAAECDSREVSDLRAGPRGSPPRSGPGIGSFAQLRDGLLGELEHRQPKSLGWLLGALRSGELSLEPLTDRLSTAGHRRLLGGILAASSGTGDTVELERAIDSYARRTGSRRVFYRKVLERLLADDLLDLESIAADSVPQEEVSGAPGGAYRSAVRDAVANAPLAGGTEAEGPGDERILETYLREGRLVSGSGRGHLMRQAERLLAVAPERFGASLREALNGEAAIARFVGLLPARLLRQSLQQLAPLVHESVQRYADAMVHACDGQDVGIGADRIPGLKWRFCFQYLLEPGPDPDAASFLRGFAGYLEKHSRRSNARDLDALLRRSLARIEGVTPADGGELPARQPTPSIRSAGDRHSRPDAGGLGLTEPIADTVRTRPDRFRRLFSELRTGGVDLSRLAEGLSGTDLRSLVHAFLGLIPGSEAADRAQLARTIDAHAAQAVSEREFFGQVLERLVGDELIDLEAIAADVASSEGTPLRSDAPEPEGAVDMPDQPPTWDEIASAIEVLPSARPEQDQDVLEDGIWIANAGQVIAAPYLPRLFGMLGLVEQGAFESLKARERAVHLLQFMVDGSDDAPEYELVLNKLLCGLDLQTPVSRGTAVADGERQAVEGLLRAMIQHWAVLGRTSLAGFRESFLRRGGLLEHRDGGWHLSVEPRAFDMLLDRIPWGFSPIRHPWMNEVIHVVWR
jgi:hypothetical protein